MDLPYSVGLLLIAPATPECCVAASTVPLVIAASRFVVSASRPPCEWDTSGKHTKKATN